MTLPERSPLEPAGEASVPEGIGLYQLLVESVRDYAIFALDPTGVIVTWNTGAERFKGYKAHEIIGRHFSTFYPPEDIASGKPAEELVIAARDGRVEDEGWRLRKDGSRLWANVIITALRRPNGELVGFAKVTRDLTERKEAELKERVAMVRAAEAEAANRTKSEFLAAMSHELRTPLNAIGGYAELLRMGVRGQMNQQQEEDLDRIIVAQRHLLGIINDLLNFSRIEAGKLTYDIAPVDVSAVISAVVEMVKPLAAAKNIELTIDDCTDDSVAFGDKAKVEQIVINLASNAVNYTEPGGRVSVGCRIDGDRVCAHVTDNGIGIASDKLETIFEPFVQVGRTLSTGHHGTGLGLAISRDLARAMNGELTVESSPGGGLFVLPLPAPDQAWGGGRNKLSARLKLPQLVIRPDSMFLDPRALFMLVLLVGVTGWVLKGLMVTWHRINKGEKPSTAVLNGMEDRLRNVEAATSSLLVDVTSIREKQRFMAKLQSGAEVSALPARAAVGTESDISPLSTQNIPIIPRAGKR